MEVQNTLRNQADRDGCSKTTLQEKNYADGSFA